MKHIFLILTACMLMTSCIQRTKVTGTIEHCKESYAMLYKMHPYGLEFQDTVLLIKGRFTQHLDTGVNIYILRFNDTCLASFITTTGSEINITAQSPAINHTLTVTGKRRKRTIDGIKTAIINFGRPSTSPFRTIYRPTTIRTIG
ncbi:MAG: hypothetical protein J6U29_01950 [Bacteroidales bacterium]|nr:hypothetical protein [Bacteroidales bacterium]